MVFVVSVFLVVSSTCSNLQYVRKCGLSKCHLMVLLVSVALMVSSVKTEPTEGAKPFMITKLIFRDYFS